MQPRKIIKNNLGQSAYINKFSIPSSEASSVVNPYNNQHPNVVILQSKASYPHPFTNMMSDPTQQIGAHSFQRFNRPITPSLPSHPLIPQESIIISNLFPTLAELKKEAIDSTPSLRQSRNKPIDYSAYSKKYSENLQPEKKVNVSVDLQNYAHQNQFPTIGDFKREIVYSSQSTRLTKTASIDYSKCSKNNDNFQKIKINFSEYLKNYAHPINIDVNNRGKSESITIYIFGSSHANTFKSENGKFTYNFCYGDGKAVENELIFCTLSRQSKNFNQYTYIDKNGLKIIPKDALRFTSNHQPKHDNNKQTKQHLSCKQFGYLVDFLKNSEYKKIKDNLPILIKEAQSTSCNKSLNSVEQHQTSSMPFSPASSSIPVSPIENVYNNQSPLVVSGAPGDLNPCTSQINLLQQQSIYTNPNLLKMTLHGNTDTNQSSTLKRNWNEAFGEEVDFDFRILTQDEECQINYWDDDAQEGISGCSKDDVRDFRKG